MPRKVKRPSGPPEYEAKYYGPAHNTRADDRNPSRTQYDGDARKPPKVGVSKGGKTKTVLRDPAAYDRRDKRPRRD